MVASTVSFSYFISKHFGKIALEPRFPLQEFLKNFSFEIHKIHNWNQSSDSFAQYIRFASLLFNYAQCAIGCFCNWSIEKCLCSFEIVQNAASIGIILCDASHIKVFCRTKIKNLRPKVRGLTWKAQS